MDKLQERLEELAESENQREETTMNPGTAGQASRENIYTEQVGQFINATDEILTHVHNIASKISVILEPEPSKDDQSVEGMPDVPATSPTELSGCLAALASHLAKLGEYAIRLENRIIV